MTNIIHELDLLHRAMTYGDVEPLLECFVDNGLHDKTARELVASLARGESLRGKGKPKDATRDRRDRHIRWMVANRQGVLERAGNDPRKAFAAVAQVLQSMGDGLDQKQIKRIWDSRPMNGTERIAYESALQNGLEITITPDI